MIGGTPDQAVKIYNINMLLKNSDNFNSLSIRKTIHFLSNSFYSSNTSRQLN